jgi:hypothetical protein
MTRQEDEELLNREIDGENSEDESAALAARLAGDPELRARHEVLARVAQALARARDVEPPRGLYEDVVRGIRAKHPAVGRRFAWSDVTGALLGRAPALRYTLIFSSGLAAGLLMAALLGQSLRLPLLDGGKLVGTILPTHRLGSLEDVDRQTFELPGARGEIATKRGHGVVVAEIRVSEAERPVDLSVDLGGPAFSPLAFERTDGAGGDVTLAGGQWRLSHAEAGRYALLLGVRAAGPSRLRFRLSLGGATLEKILATGGETTNYSDH